VQHFNKIKHQIYKIPVFSLLNSVFIDSKELDKANDFSLSKLIQISENLKTLPKGIKISQYRDCFQKLYNIIRYISLIFFIKFQIPIPNSLPLFEIRWEIFVLANVNPKYCDLNYKYLYVGENELNSAEFSPSLAFLIWSEKPLENLCLKNPKKQLKFKRKTELQKKILYSIWVLSGFYLNKDMIQVILSYVYY